MQFAVRAVARGLEGIKVGGYDFMKEQLVTWCLSKGKRAISITFTFVFPGPASKTQQLASNGTLMMHI